MQNRPSEERPCERRMTMKDGWLRKALESCPVSLRSVLGAVLPVARIVPASALDPRIVYSLHAGYRVECETSGLDSAVEAESSPVRQAHPFDRLRMTLSGVEWVRAPSKVEGLALGGHRRES